MIFGIGWLEVSIIVFTMMLLFGANRLPEMGSSIGKFFRSLKEEMNDTSSLKN